MLRKYELDFFKLLLVWNEKEVNAEKKKRNIYYQRTSLLEHLKVEKTYYSIEE